MISALTDAAATARGITKPIILSMATPTIDLITHVYSKRKSSNPRIDSTSGCFTREKSASFAKIGLALKKKKRTGSEQIRYQILGTKPKKISFSGHKDNYMRVLAKEEDFLETKFGATSTYFGLASEDTEEVLKLEIINLFMCLDVRL